MIDGVSVEFELKSTTKSSITTARDVGMEHLEKWKNKHWLFGFYTEKGNALKYTKYASPSMMREWIEEKRSYILPDHMISKIVSSRVTIEDMNSVIGKKAHYSIEDAMALHKKQFSVSEYRARFDLDGGYSPQAMLDIFRLRVSYVSARGSTLNNPHIPSNVLDPLPKITQDHAEALRRLVRASLQ
ncbi:MAG: hypothetical protein V4753_11555 [Pseudomonadota bacterium]